MVDNIGGFRSGALFQRRYIGLTAGGAKGIFMGWMYCQRPRGVSDTSFFNDQLCGERSRVVDAARWRGVSYLALEVPDGVIGVVCLTVTRARANDRLTFGYKDMTEDMGPVEARCPVRILDLLSPLDQILVPGSDGHRYAAEWREQCRSYWQRRAERPRVSAGDLVVFDNPLDFNDGETHQALTFLSGSTFTDPRGVLRYRVSGWRDRDYQVLAA